MTLKKTEKFCVDGQNTPSPLLILRVDPVYLNPLAVKTNTLVLLQIYTKIINFKINTDMLVN